MVGFLQGLGVTFGDAYELPLTKLTWTALMVVGFLKLPVGRYPQNGPRFPQADLTQRFDTDRASNRLLIHDVTCYVLAICRDCL